MTMEINDQKIKEILIEENERFKTLSLRHREFDQRLRELTKRDVLTDTEMIEEKNLKKEKLKIKDSMQQYIFEYRKRAR